NRRFMRPLVIVLICFLLGSHAWSQESSPIVWPKRLEPSATNSDAPVFVAESVRVAPPYEFETVIRPDRFTGKDASITWDFLTENGDGYRIKFAPRDGGIRLLQMKQGRLTPNEEFR